MLYKNLPFYYAPTIASGLQQLSKHLEVSDAITQCLVCKLQKMLTIMNDSLVPRLLRQGYCR